MRTDEPLRIAALPVYLVAVLLVLLPLVDTALSTWPLRFGEVAWRFGAVGLFSRALLTPLLGLTLLLVVALLDGRRWIVHTVTVLTAVGALLLLAAIPVFTLDYMQMRSQVQGAAESVIDAASLLAVGKLAAFAVVAIVLTAASWRAARRSRAGVRGQPAAAGSRPPGDVLLKR